MKRNARSNSFTRRQSSTPAPPVEARHLLRTLTNRLRFRPEPRDPSSDPFFEVDRSHATSNPPCSRSQRGSDIPTFGVLDETAPYRGSIMRFFPDRLQLSASFQPPSPAIGQPWKKKHGPFAYFPLLPRCAPPCRAQCPGTVASPMPVPAYSVAECRR